MRFTLPKKDLQAILDMVGRNALDEKTHIPALSKIHVHAHASMDGRPAYLRFEAHSLDATLRLEIPGEVETTGGILLPRDLTKRVHHMPEGLLTLSGKDGHQIVLESTTEKRRFTVFGLPEQDFPTTLVAPDGDRHSIPTSVLSLLINAVEDAMSTDESKPHVNALMLQWRDGSLRAVTTDGHRLMTIYRSVSGLTGHHDLLIRRAHVKVLQAILERAQKENQTTVDIIPGDKRFAVFSGNVEYVARLCEEQFPPYQQALPGAFRRRVTVNKAKFIDAISALSLVSNVSLVFSSTDGKKLVVEASSPESGSSDDSMDIESFLTDPGVTTAFRTRMSPKYLKQAAESMEGDTIIFGATDYNRIVVLAPGSETADTPAKADHVAVVMPMND